MSAQLPNPNNVNDIRASLRCGLAPHKLAAIATPTIFWSVARFHTIQESVALAIVEKHTANAAINWSAAVTELDSLIVPF